MTGTPTANAVTAIELAFRNARRPPLVAALVAAEVGDGGSEGCGWGP